jgi:PPOX class probable F420-dependent enzyme
MQRMTAAEARSFLDRGARTATFATVRPDGRPHAVPTWYLADGADFVFTTWHTTVKVRNLRADPRAALVVQDPDPPYDYATVEGRAEIIDDLVECRRIATALGVKYMGEDRAEAFGARNGVPGELVVRLRPTAIHGFAKVAE